MTEADRSPAAGGFVLTPRARLVVLGAAVIVLALMLPWSRNGWFEESGDGSTNTLGITTQMLWDTTPATLDGTPLITPLGLAVVAIVIGALVDRARWLSVVGSAAVVVIALLFINGLRAIDADYDLPGSVWSTTGIGTWLAIVAGLATLVAATRNAPMRSTKLSQ